MVRWLRWTASAALLVAIGVGAGWPFLDPAGRNGLLAAGGIAVAVQAVSFAAFNRLQEQEHGVLLALLVGAAARFGALGITGAVAMKVDTGLGRTPLILGLATFLFGLLMLEALFVKGTTPTPTTE